MTSERAQLDETYPVDSPGSCLIIGIPPADRANEPVPIDLVRAVFYAVSATRKNLRTAKHQEPRTRVEIFGAIPRALTTGTVSPAEVLRGNTNGGNDQESKILRGIEDDRELILRVLGDEFELDDLDVVTLTNKLRDPDSHREFVESFTNARAQLHRTLHIDSARGVRVKVLEQALMDLVPHWMKQGADTETINRLLNYALSEVLGIIRKVTKRVLLFHYRRESAYLPLVRAYMDQLLGLPTQRELVDQYVRMPSDVEGLKLPPSFPIDKKPPVKENSLRLKATEPYRVGPGQEERRLLLDPPDSIEVIKAKLGRDDLPRNLRDRYLFEMVGRILSMARELLEHQNFARRRFEQLLPSGVLEDPEKLSKESDRVLEAFHELILNPLSQGITSARAAARQTSPASDSPAK